MNQNSEMNLIAGIGGVFLFSNNPRALAAWYHTALGIIPSGQDEECRSIYKTFESHDPADPSKKRTMTWAILAAEKDISAQPRTGRINYRVTDMARIIAHLKAQGIQIADAKNYEYGKFAWLTDPDGNRVELFEEL